MASGWDGATPGISAIGASGVPILPCRHAIDVVRDELAGKAIVYNLCRAIMLRPNAKELPEKEAESA
jgi:hypothetical protein